MKWVFHLRKKTKSVFKFHSTFNLCWLSFSFIDSGGVFQFEVDMHITACPLPQDIHCETILGFSTKMNNQYVNNEQPLNVTQGLYVYSSKVLFTLDIQIKNWGIAMMSLFGQVICMATLNFCLEVPNDNVRLCTDSWINYLPAWKQCSHAFWVDPSIYKSNGEHGNQWRRFSDKQRPWDCSIWPLYIGNWLLFEK